MREIEELTDEDLMLALTSSKGSNDVAFCALAERYMDRIYFFTCRLLGNKDEAEDATQEIFLKLWQAPHRFEANREHKQGSFRAWLWTIAANYCRDQLRKRKFHHNPDALENIIDFTPLPDKQTEDAHELNAVIQKIEQLPERQRQALYLYVYDELSYKEIARLMEVSPAAVESLLSRARASLKDHDEPTLNPIGEAANAC